MIDRESIIKAYLEGELVKDILEKHGIPGGVAYQIFREANIPMRGKGNKKTTTMAHTVITESIEHDGDYSPTQEGKKSYRIRLLVSLGVQADDIEDAIKIARGYNGITEILSISRRH